MLDMVKEFVVWLVPTWVSVGVVAVLIAFAIAYHRWFAIRVHKRLFPEAGVPGSAWHADPLARAPFAMLLISAFLVLISGFTFTTVLICVPIAIWVLGGTLKRSRRFAGSTFECLRCAYERPADRTEGSELCPECGNAWWRDDVLWSEDEPEGAVGARLKATDSSRRAARIVVGSAMVMCVIVFAGVVAHASGALQPYVPRAFLEFDLKYSDRSHTGKTLDELISRPSTTQRQRDSYMRTVLDRRDRGVATWFDLSEAFDDALGDDAFDAELLDEFYSGTNTWTLSADVSADGKSVTPRLHLVTRERSFGYTPRVVSSGVRINDGVFAQATSSHQDPTSFADTFLDYKFLDGSDEPLNEVTARANIPWTAPFTPVGIESLPPGRHEMTLRLHMFVAPNVTTQTVMIDTDGRFVRHPDVKWHETLDLTASFTVPASAR